MIELRLSKEENDKTVDRATKIGGMLFDLTPFDAANVIIVLITVITNQEYPDNRERLEREKWIDSIADAAKKNLRGFHGGTR